MVASTENNWREIYPSLIGADKSPVERQVAACVDALRDARWNYIEWREAQRLSGQLMNWAVRESRGEEGYNGYLAAMSEPAIRREIEGRVHGHGNFADNLEIVLRCIDGETIAAPTWKPKNPFYQLAARSGLDVPADAAQMEQLVYDALTLAIRDVTPRFDSVYGTAPLKSEVQLLLHLRSCVDPDLEKRPLFGQKGMIGIGPYAAKIGDIYDVMTAWHPVVRTDDKVTNTSWCIAMANVMGADGFTALEGAFTIEILSKRVNEQFKWVDAWYWQPKHLGAALVDMQMFEPGHPKHADARDNVSVWTKMRKIAGDVQAATLEAVKTGLLSTQGVARITELTNHFYGADFGGDDQGRDWAPRWTATLKAVSNVAEKLHRLGPTLATEKFVTTVRTAMADHETAKQLPSKKPMAPVITPEGLEIFGSRYVPIEGPVSRPQALVA